jgi:hypothetical protein
MKRTKKPKVGSLVFDRDQQDWGYVIEIENKKNHILYTIQFINDPEPIKMMDIHDSIFQDCYD